MKADPRMKCTDGRCCCALCTAFHTRLGLDAEAGPGTLTSGPPSPDQHRGGPAQGPVMHAHAERARPVLNRGARHPTWPGKLHRPPRSRRGAALAEDDGR